jgi:hypothetical protein
VCLDRGFVVVRGTVIIIVTMIIVHPFVAPVPPHLVDCAMDAALTMSPDTRLSLIAICI